MRQQVLTIARFTLLEALRTRLPGVVLAVLAGTVLASVFVHQITITESARIQTTFLAASLRFAAVFMTSLYVITSMMREFDDKVVELLLSLDLPRAGYVLGKGAGFVAVGVLVAAVITLPFFYLATIPAAMLWGASLALELVIVSALSLFCVVTFRGVMSAASFVLGFYLLARSISAIRLIGGSALLDELAPARGFMTMAAETMAFVLPALDSFTRSEWLVDAVGSWDNAVHVMLAAAVYAPLLVMAALFDFYRREF